MSENEKRKDREPAPIPPHHLRYFGQSAIVQYHIMAHFITLYRAEKEVIEKDILPAEIEEKKSSIGDKKQ